MSGHFLGIGGVVGALLVIGTCIGAGAVWQLVRKAKQNILIQRIPG